MLKISDEERVVEVARQILNSLPDFDIREIF
jgi:hypothetical protein